MSLLKSVTIERVRGWEGYNLQCSHANIYKPLRHQKDWKKVLSLYYINQQKGLTTKEEGYKEILHFIHLGDCYYPITYDSKHPSIFLLCITTKTKYLRSQSIREIRKIRGYVLTWSCNISQGPETLGKAQKGVDFAIHRRAQLGRTNRELDETQRQKTI